jgi:hypothetical protein
MDTEARAAEGTSIPVMKLIRAPFSLASFGLGFAAAGVFSIGVAILSALLGVRHLLDFVAVTLASFVWPHPVGTSSSWVGDGEGRLGLGAVLAVLGLAAAIWSLFGVAIARIAALRLAADRSAGLREALEFARGNARSAILYAVLVTLTIAVLVFLCGLAGALGQIPYVGPVLLILLFPLAILGTLLAALVGIAAVFGIGITTASFAVERCGTLDALSRTFSYLFSRPLHALVYIGLAYLFSSFLYFVGHQLVVNGTFAALRSVAYGDVARTVFPAALGDVPLKEVRVFPESLAALFLYLFVWLARQAVLGGVIAYVLASGTSAYLLLRRDVDGIDEREIEQPEMAPSVNPAPAGFGAQPSVSPSPIAPEPPKG